MKKLKPLASLFFLLLIITFVSACADNEETSTSPSNADENNNETAIDNEADTITLRASSGITSEHTWHIGFFQPFADTIESETNGMIDFEIFTAGELVPLGTEFDALRQGIIDISFTLMPPYDPQRFPYTEVTTLPLLVSDSKIATKAMHNMMHSDRIIADGKTYYELEFADKGLVAFSNPPSEPYVLTTTNQKFEEVDDFNESIRLRSPSRVHEILAGNLGITPLSMPVTDAYDALSRNALDGMFLSITDGVAFGVNELLKHTIEGANLGHFVGMTAMTQETWDQLPQEVQEMMTKAADEIIYEGANVWMEGTVIGKEDNIEKGGEYTHLNDLNEKVKDHINQAIVDTWFEWIDNLESQGHAGIEMAKLWRDLLVDAGASVPQEIMEIE
ncbi:TRAP transporter substrate-binding protein DctP [Alkalihalobacterium alkalinitrilicum]|uniref:TRAP transporter substrate-binding protein DctP n=1 Tax=Alkalihalobacterium alkalinitrilicum TaxID=427920 RepID=UPI000995AA20|nr:TRAP transporter substrate-binding protein DctP [Alkalihalobacterium alkalinitrilicum]